MLYFYDDWKGAKKFTGIGGIENKSLDKKMQYRKSVYQLKCLNLKSIFLKIF